jgi:FdhD protein
VRIDGGSSVRRPDTLVAEEPLEIRLGGEPLSVTMRTPGHDFELVLGWLLTEGVVTRGDAVAQLRYCAGTDENGANTYNVVEAVLEAGAHAHVADARRAFDSTSSCGVCGKTSIDAVRVRTFHDVAADGVTVTAAVLSGLPDALRASQRVFDTTGALHAAGLFAPDGTALCVREDVGRHNAVDKVIGWAAREGRLPLHGTVLMVSGRASFELTQKAAVAGIPVLAAVSAPTTLAVDLAAEAGVTLVGFLRGTSMNVYSHPHRVLATA